MKLGAFEECESQLSFALLFMSIRAFSEKKNYPKFSLYVRWGGTSNLQGGAIAAGSGAKVEINICAFISNTANSVSLFLELFLRTLSEPALCSMSRGRDIQPSSIDHYAPNSARINMKLGAIAWGESQFSFALLFISIQAFSEKKNYPKFSLHVLGAGHPTNFN